MDPLVHGWLPLLGPFHTQQFHQRLNRDALQKHREVNHGNGSCHKDRLRLHVFRVDEQDQSESHGSAQSTVGHNKLVNVREFVYPEPIRDGRQQNDAEDAEQGAEDNR